MAMQFNPKYLELNSIASLLEIQCDLIDKEVIFVPEVGFVEDVKDKNNTGIKNLVVSWINGK